jgi:hypothetical protein
MLINGLISSIKKASQNEKLFCEFIYPKLLEDVMKTQLYVDSLKFHEWLVLKALRFLQ